MRKSKTDLFTVIGLLLIAAALFLALRNIYMDRQAGETAAGALDVLRSEIPVKENETFREETPLYEEYEDVDMPQIEVDGSKYIGILSLPTINIELPIKGGFSYPALTGAPCCYKGSVYTDDIIIAGHNFPSHFAKLKALSQGDRVSFTDGDGNVFLYEVAETVQLNGTDVEGMLSGEWDMTLFTCTLSGKSRIAVRLIRLEK